MKYEISTLAFSGNESKRSRKMHEKWKKRRMGNSLRIEVSRLCDIMMKT